MQCSCVKNLLEKGELCSDTDRVAENCFYIQTCWYPTAPSDIHALDSGVTDSQVSRSQKALQLFPVKLTIQFALHTPEQYTAVSGNVSINYLLIIIYLLLLIEFLLMLAGILLAKSDAFPKVKCFWTPFRMNIHYPLVPF